MGKGGWASVLVNIREVRSPAQIIPASRVDWLISYFIGEIKTARLKKKLIAEQSYAKCVIVCRSGNIICSVINVTGYPGTETSCRDDKIIISHKHTSYLCCGISCSAPEKSLGCSIQMPLRSHHRDSV